MAAYAIVRFPDVLALRHRRGNILAIIAFRQFLDRIESQRDKQQEKNSAPPKKMLRAMDLVNPVSIAILPNG